MADQIEIAERSGTMGAQSEERLARVHSMMAEPANGPATEELLAKRDALLKIADEHVT
jgi:beta-N-acetylhexosaminidase